MPFCLALILLNASPTTSAQGLDLGSVHWAYSSYFGTGWYQVSGNRDVYVLRMTPRWDLREASIDENGRQIGIHLKFPITAGLDRFITDDLPDFLDPDNLASIAVNPAIDIDIPINRRWSLRPYASIGWGTLVDGSDSAWTYWTGIKSRFTFETGKLNWALLNTIGYVGYTPKEESAEDFWPIMVGLEFEYPIGAPTVDKDQYVLYWHTTYSTYEDDLEFDVNSPESAKITDQWELAIAFGKRDKRMNFWLFKFDRLGLGYRASSDGQLKGITFVFRSVFDL